VQVNFLPVGKDLNNDALRWFFFDAGYWMLALTSAIQYQASSIKHQASSIKHQASSIA